MNVKLGCCNKDLPGAGIFAHEFIKMAGLDGMSIEFGYLEDGFPVMSKAVQKFYVEAAEKYGIEYPSVSCSGYDFMRFSPGFDTPEWELSKKVIERSVDCAVTVGASYIMIPTFGSSQIKNDEELKLAIDGYKYACEVASKRNIKVGIESALHPDTQIDIINEVGRDVLGVFFDSQNFIYNHSVPQLEAIDKLYDYMLPILHVKDGEDGKISGKPLGTGHASFFEQIEYLKKKNFEGWIVCENYYNKFPLRDLDVDPVEIFMKDMETLKNAVK